MNIPLDNRLDRGGEWERFEGPWNRAHTVRTLLTVAVAVLRVV